MLVKLQTTGESAVTRPSPGKLLVVLLLAPALIVVMLLFGGGLLLGMLQGLGYFPGAEDQSFTLQNFRHFLEDRDLLKSLGLKLYI